MTDIVNVKIIPAETSDFIVREVIALSLAVSTAVILVLVQRKVSDPDFFLSCRMRTFNAIARYADNRSHFWRDVSSKATSMYLDSRP